MKDEGNVAVELILAVTLLVSLLIPGTSTIAEYLDARRDVHSTAVAAARLWSSTSTQSQITEFVTNDAAKLFNRPMTVVVQCEINCSYPGTRITLRVSTYVDLFKRFTITESEYLVQNEVG